MNKAGKYERLISLDLFRGVTICLMIVVGASGNYAYTYRMLDHAPWSGFTPTDLIFPSFLFIVGVAQSLSLRITKGDLSNQVQKRQLLKIARRTVILFLLGILINWFPFCFRDESGSIRWLLPEQVRLMGVLQRIALAYGISSLAILFLSLRQIVALAFSILIFYVLLLHIGAVGDPYSVTGNLVARIDLSVLGAGHMYREQGMPFDPEGLLSTLPAIVNVLGGYITGKYLMKQALEATRALKLMIAGSALLIAGYIWSYFDPVNKKLWTSSFTMITTGADILLFITVYYCVDVLRKPLPFQSFFICFGRNPILIYLFSELLMKGLLFPAAGSGTTIYSWLYSHYFSEAGFYNGALLQAICYMLLSWVLVWILNKKQYYLKI